MMSTTEERRRPARRATAVATLAIGALGLIAGLAPAAFAQDTSTTTQPDDPPAAPGNRPNRPKLTDAQKTCLQGQGIEKPTKNADGKPVKPTDEQRAKFAAAAKACGIELPARPDGPPHPKLTDAQKTCLQGQGIEKPTKNADGKPVKPTDEQRAKFAAAAKACGIELPARPADGNATGSSNSNGTSDSNSTSSTSTGSSST
jgi:hypothetical protein